MYPARPHRVKAKQHGAALLVMLVIVVMGAATSLVSSLSTTALKNARQEKTAASLAQAKDALIGKAIIYSDYPGSLPCPDTDNDGDSDSVGGSPNDECPKYVGRLPWKTLGLPDLRDAAGERLWYTLSRNFRRYISVRPLNSDTTGTLNITGDYTASNLVAIVFSPGAPVSSQARGDINTACTLPFSSDPKCMPSNYLEGSNANPSPGVAPNTNYRYELQSDSFNDQLIGISYQQLLPLVEKRIAREAKNCLDNYAVDSNYKYPWATPVPDTSNYLGTINTFFGRIPRTPAIQTNSASIVAGFIDALSTLQFQLTQLQSALNNYSSTLPNPTQSARDGLTTAGTNTKNAGDAMENIAVSATDPITGTIAELAKKAGEKGEDAGDLAKKLAKDPPESTTAAVQSKINDSRSKINDTMTELVAAYLIDGAMKLTWPSSCTTFAVTYWSDWKDLVFYQVADGYKPGSAASCGNCLSVEGGGHNLAGSGSYRATVIVAGKKLTANRTPSIVEGYLEADNLLPRNDTTKPYKTYRVTDTAYQSVNDLVLCLDEKVNCK